jgi:hypothetical protein
MEPSIVPVKAWSIFSVWAWALAMLRINVASPAQKIVKYARLPERLFPLMKIAPAPIGLRALQAMVPRNCVAE